MKDFSATWENLAIFRPTIFPGQKLFLGACFELFVRIFGHLAAVYFKMQKDAFIYFLRPFLAAMISMRKNLEMPRSK
jgi:hypothetical protein